MRTGSVAFALGILGLSGLHFLPDIRLLVLILPLCMAMLYFKRARLAGFFLLGFVWAFIQASLALGKELPPTLDGKFALINGTVASLPEQRTNAVRFLFAIDGIEDEQGGSWPSPGKVRLSWYRSLELPKPGERWQLYVKLRRPRGFMNPGGFDYEGWLFQKKIRATGYVKSSPKNRKISDTGTYLFDQWRHKIGGKIDHYVAGEYAGPIRALAIGDRSKVSSEQWRLLRGTGTNHLLAISGLHLGLVAVMAFFLGRWLWSWNSRLTGLLSARKFSALFAVAAGFIYAGLAGFSLPTQRALIMLCMFMSNILLGGQWRISYVMATAVFLILFLYPFSVLAVEFWLSFSAVLIIVYILACRREHPSWFHSLVKVQFFVPLGLAPLLLFWFQEVPINSFFANLLAVPVTTLLLIPCTLVATLSTTLLPEMAGFLYEVTVLIITPMFAYLEFLRGLPFSNRVFPAPSLLALVFAVTGMAIVFMPRGLPGRWLGLCCFMPLLWPNIELPRTNSFHLYLLDVGQGLSAVITTRNHTLIYDSGPFWSDSFDAGRSVIVPFLRSRGISEVDVLLLSHGDKDHIGGADSLLAAVRVNRILVNTNGITFDNRQPCLSGTRWQWDGVDFEVLHPQESGTVSANNSSCVLKVSSGTVSVLLPGDVERSAERKMIAAWRDKLDADILIAPHHGSATSSSADFIRAVSPRVVLFPAGYRNRFGFPKPDIINRYQDAGVRVLSTANSGMIAFAGDREMVFSRYRQEHRRFWHSSDTWREIE